ncbi:hypothetical protein AAVH_25095 [Aphelenchoides avenae]|nr:hypothetical protein AAVH_25095 [Aphelenchus avenae]
MFYQSAERFAYFSPSVTPAVAAALVGRLRAPTTSGGVSKRCGGIRGLFRSGFLAKIIAWDSGDVYRYIMILER